MDSIKEAKQYLEQNSDLKKYGYEEIYTGGGIYVYVKQVRGGSLVINTEDGDPPVDGEESWIVIYDFDFIRGPSEPPKAGKPFKNFREIPSLERELQKSI